MPERRNLCREKIQKVILLSASVMLTSNWVLRKSMTFLLVRLGFYKCNAAKSLVEQSRTRGNSRGEAGGEDIAIRIVQQHGAVEVTRDA
jgi:hypothetical protein